MPSAHVTLVGRRLEHNENLGLCYLRAALEQAGARVTVLYLNDAVDLARAAQRVLLDRPDVLGLALADGGSATLPLALGEAVERAGYRGHVTAGGQFATLARQWLLARYPWLDSVVRFAGERPIVAIAERASRGQDVLGIAGVTTRGGDGAPADVVDPRPLVLHPAHDELPDVLGYPAAHITASRGCWGRCQYCGPAALSTQERREGIAAGVSSAALTARGVGGLKRREIERVADEMAMLWHERGVRYFYFVDEHLLPYGEAEALDYIATWKRALAERKMGAFGIGAMMRADRMTPAVVAAFADLGLVRAFVGLEIATDDEGRHFGRRAPGTRELELFSAFEAHGVATVGNLMLVHPYSTAQSITAGIDLLERVPAGVFEATRMMVYHGTRLMKSMAEEGRLLGNPLRYGYTFEDPAMERFAEIFTRLRGEVFWDYSLAYRTHDAFLAFGLARRVAAERVSAALGARIERARRDVNRLYVDAYRRALSLALGGSGFRGADQLVAELLPRSRDIERQLEAVEHELLTPVRAGARMFSPMRSAAASAITFALACGGETTSAGPPKDASVDVPGGSGGSGATGGFGGSGATGGSGGSGGSCSPADVEPAKQAVRDLLKANAPCFSGSVEFSAGGKYKPTFSFGSYSGMLSLHACNTPASQAATDEMNAAANAALAGSVPACILGGGTGPEYVNVQGGATTESDQMTAAINQACASLLTFNAQFTIVLDQSGKVTQVTSDPSAAQLAACVQKALTGLTFPCLASFEVCPEYVIAE